MIKITLFGPTGLIGNEILKLLENDSDFENINVVSIEFPKSFTRISKEFLETIVRVAIKNQNNFDRISIEFR